MLIDLHTHSAVSDGTDSPTELMHAAAAAGLDVVALTDHDTTAGWQEASAAVGATGVALVRGTEISTRADGISVHLLSYLHDPADPALTEIFARSRSSRETRAQAIVERLGADMTLTWADIEEQAGDGATIGRPHIADALVARGYAVDRAEVFATLLHPTGPYYVRYWSAETAEAIDAVRAAGGVPVMAHPRASARGRVVSADAIGQLADAGLVGLEIDHLDHTDADREWLRALAADLGLLVTGSSDYHGTGKPNRLAAHTTDPGVLEAIESQGRLPVLRP